MENPIERRESASSQIHSAAPAAVTGVVPGLNRFFDLTVLAAHRLLPGSYHPYFLAEDAAAVCFIAIGFAFRAWFGVLHAFTHATVIAVTFGLYVLVFLKLKRRLTGVGARSAIQDSLLFVAPVYLGLSWALGQPMAAALDVLAFSLLLAVGWMRIGCFLGGCCHGRPARLGVLYPPCVLRSVHGPRLFTPAPPAGARVFPLQLLESLWVFSVAAALWWRESTLTRPDGSALAFAVMAYSALRFCSEWARGHRHRPSYFGLSEAQWFSLGLMIASGVLLYLH